MKIITQKQLLEMPSNTLFQKYAPCYTENLGIFIERCGERDFFYEDIDGLHPSESTGSSDMSNILDRCQASGESYDVDLECSSRDGCFEDDQLYIVWEKKDLLKLIERLNKCL